MSFSPFIRSRICGIRPVMALAAFTQIAFAEGPSLAFGAAGWMGYGSIVSSSDTVDGNDYSGKPMISSGAQILLQSQLNENLGIQVGVGAGGGHQLVGSVKTKGGYSPFGVGPYVAQGNFTYNFWKEEGARLFARGGLFAYDYAQDNQNLGLYLLRGPVYPGFLLSGFETKHVLPVANTLGLQVHHETGGFQQDLLIQVETEFYPYYDISPAYVASYRAGSAFRIGGGINLYHLIPVDPVLTTDTTSMRRVDNSGPVPDTVQLSAKGIKLMVNAGLDFKALFGGEGALGPEDLKLYGEVALLGLGGLMRDDFHFFGDPIKYRKNNKKVYEDLYGPLSQRMPVMVGFNLPTFKLLDRLSLEIEHYGAPFSDNLALFNHWKATRPSPIPLDPDSSITRDNLKWSLYGSKVFQSHIKVSLQVASDHFRPGTFTGYGDNNPPGSEAILFRPSEWYWMSKVAYFF